MKLYFLGLNARLFYDVRFIIRIRRCYRIGLRRVSNIVPRDFWLVRSSVFTVDLIIIGIVDGYLINLTQLGKGYQNLFANFFVVIPRDLVFALYDFQSRILRETFNFETILSIRAGPRSH